MKIFFYHGPTGLKQSMGAFWEKERPFYQTVTLLVPFDRILYQRVRYCAVQRNQQRTLLSGVHQRYGAYNVSREHPPHILPQGLLNTSLFHYAFCYGSDGLASRYTLYDCTCAPGWKFEIGSPFNLRPEGPRC